jgi:hypothetical protein
LIGSLIADDPAEPTWTAEPSDGGSCPSGTESRPAFADAYFDAGFSAVVQDVVLGPALASWRPSARPQPTTAQRTRRRWRPDQREWSLLRRRVTGTTHRGRCHALTRHYDHGRSAIPVALYRSIPRLGSRETCAVSIRR